LYQFLDELLLASSELGSSCPGSVHVEFPCFWVIFHHLQKLLLLEAESNKELAVTRLISELRLQVVEYLVVSKVGVRWQDEELKIRIITLTERQRDAHHSVLYHDQFREAVSTIYDWVSREIQSRVDVAQKITLELTAALEILIVEQIKEVGHKVAEQSAVQTVSHSRFELHVEFLSCNLPKVVLI
jgi:hypothetical protein